MKILYAYPKFTNAAGTERILIDKINYFADKKGYEVFVLTYEQGQHSFIYPISHNARHIDLGVRYCELYNYGRLSRFFKWKLYDRLLKKRFSKVVHDYHPDIVITTTYFVNLLSAISSCKVPFIRVLESHIDRRYILSNNPLNKTNFLHWLRTWFEMRDLLSKSSCFDVLVALNRNDAQDWSGYLKSVIIENLVHLNPMGRLCSHQSKHAIFVGRYTWQKGVDDLLKIWNIVYSKYPDWHLDMYGEGDLSDYLLKEAARLQANIHVNLPTSNIFDKYLNSSLLLMTSNYEPFGLVMPEAMSCGLPVIAFDCPSGPANIISDGVDGYLIKNRDISLFADRVCSLIESPALRMKMGQSAIDSSTRFSPENIMPQWESLFQKLVATKTR